MYNFKVLVGGVIVAACGFLVCGCGGGDEDETPAPIAESEGAQQKQQHYEKKAEKKEAATGVSFGP